jgi:O-antigen/teichoic acid export membrane protein
MIQISKRDVYWNYAATFLKIASSMLVLPFILHWLPSEEIGIWTIYMAVAFFSGLMDFGFNPTFTRNVTYILQGVRNLKENGFEPLTSNDADVDYNLLTGLIKSMQWIYLRISLILFLILVTAGTFYIHSLLKNFSGSRGEVYISWFILISLNSFNIYSQYYESLLLGKGLVRKSKQIIVIGQIFYLLIVIALIMAGYGLIAIVSAQAVSVLIIRWLSYKAFFTPELKKSLKLSNSTPISDVLRKIYPNAVKIGITSIGGFLIQKSSLIIGSLYIPLDSIASYGITMQILSILSVLAGIYTNTYQPQIITMQLSGRKEEIKRIYLRGEIIMFFTFFAGGIVLVFLGQKVLDIIGSQTDLIRPDLIILATFLTLEQTNIVIAGSILLTKNEVPFFKASIVSGAAILAGLIIMFNIVGNNMIYLILVPLTVDIIYQFWKWPYEVIKDLSITFKDFKDTFIDFYAYFKRSRPFLFKYR